MKIGYPCINRSIGCKGDRTFRLKSYSEERLIETVENNLNCLMKMLAFNVDHTLLFFRITSDLVPFASHPINRFDWQNYFKQTFKGLGDFVKTHDIRISMHPDQFTLINSVNTEVFERSVKELLYHAEILDLMELDTTAKIQLHVGGVYGDKAESMQRFINRFDALDGRIQRRLVIENDDRLYTLQDCLQIHADTGIPVLFDVYHHELNNTGETVREAFDRFTKTWSEEDGVPMVDYSAQEPGARSGKHAESIGVDQFTQFIEATNEFDFDIMLEIKDKEASALKAVNVLKAMGRVR
jgi:UV DNA damage endonuclease